MKKLSLYILFFTFTNLSFAFAEEIMVVTSNKSPINECTAQQIKESFLGNIQKTPQGVEIIPLDRKNYPDDLRAKFFKSAVGLGLIQLKAFWSQRIFTGRGYPPKITEDFKKELQENPTLITFISPSELDGSLKVLLKIDVK